MVCIHGLWMNGMDMSLLRHRFEHAGYATSQFSYPTVTQSAPDNALQLGQFLQSIKADTLHLVCHSLGGLVVRHYLSGIADSRIASVVMLGTPNQGSIAADKLHDWPGGKWLLGDSLDDGLLGPVPGWDKKFPLGIIAGDLRFGMGTIIRGIPVPNDGTVTVEETHLEGMNDHVVMHATHFGLLLSQQVFNQCQHFIEHHCFLHD